MHIRLNILNAVLHWGQQAWGGRIRCVTVKGVVYDYVQLDVCWSLKTAAWSSSSNGSLWRLLLDPLLPAMLKAKVGKSVNILTVSINKILWHVSVSVAVMSRFMWFSCCISGNKAGLLFRDLEHDCGEEARYSEAKTWSFLTLTSSTKKASIAETSLCPYICRWGAE